MSGRTSPVLKPAAIAVVPTSPRKVDVWVKKWVDYSSKYGVGYILSNGCTGVYFNDSTKIVMTPEKSKFHYIEKRRSSGEEEIMGYGVDEYPKEMSKKVTLL
jgi:polo-like kinase 1